MEYVWIEFRVEVSQEEYSYRGKNGRAILKFKFPVEFKDSLDTGNLLSSLLPMAMIELRKNIAENEKQADEEV